MIDTSLPDTELERAIDATAREGAAITARALGKGLTPQPALLLAIQSAYDLVELVESHHRMYSLYRDKGDRPAARIHLVQAARAADVALDACKRIEEEWAS